MIGDTASDVNRGDDPWDSTKRALSFWYLGEFTNCRVLLTSSLGERLIDYKFTTGTHSVDGSGNVTFYLGTMPTTVWTRFERNIEADFNAVSSGTWTNTDGISIRIPGAAGTGDTWLDDIRLSNAVTVEHNTLGSGVIGHILRNTTWDANTLARTDQWFHYDQVGSVLSVSDESGDLAATHQQDAFGNVMGSWQTGMWGSGISGWHLNTKQFDSSARSLYMYRRWYIHEMGAFLSQAPYQPNIEGRYSFAEANPILSIDPQGELSIGTCIVSGACATLISWHVSRCVDICGNEWGTRKVCRPDGTYFTQVYDTGNSDSACVADCILDGATSGWRGKTFTAVCGASVAGCLGRVAGYRLHGHGPRSHHQKAKHVKIGIHKLGQKGSHKSFEFPVP